MLTSAPDHPLVRDGSLQNATKFADLVAGLSLTDTPNNWAVAFDCTNTALASAMYSNKEVVLITDLRRSGWSRDVTRAANDMAALRVPLRILDVGDRRTDNTAILKFEFEDAIALPDQPIHLAADIRNQTPSAITGEQATLSVDGDSRPVLLPDLPSGSTTHVPLSLILDAPGPHNISLALGKDALPQDDVRDLSFEVRPTVSVLLIDGSPSAQRFESETDFLALAYSVGSRPWNVQVETQFDPRRLSPGSADVPDVLGACRCSVAIGGTSQRGRTAVRRGMGLIIFSGDLVDTDSYNDRLFRDGHGVLPVKLSRPMEIPTTGVVIEKDAQSPLAPLAKLLPAALAHIQVKQYSSVVMGSREPEGTSILARWNNSENPPAVLQKTVGKGRVLLFTCTAGKKWSDWPLDPTYLLAVRSAALAIARGQDSGVSVVAGEPIQVPLEGNQAALDPKMITPEKIRPTRSKSTSRRPAQSRCGTPRPSTPEFTRSLGATKSRTRVRCDSR